MKQSCKAVGNRPDGPLDDPLIHKVVSWPLQLPMNLAADSQKAVHPVAKPNLIVASFPVFRPFSVKKSRKEDHCAAEGAASDSMLSSFRLQFPRSSINAGRQKVCGPFVEKDFKFVNLTPVQSVKIGS